jgi:glycosyltransferase involved in cell wall biosynthesis
MSVGLMAMPKVQRMPGARASERLVFVLEESLGHAAHAQNLQRVIRDEPGLDATVIRVIPGAPQGWQRIPGLRSWSFRASWQARAGLRRLGAPAPAALYIHTQVAALLSVPMMRRVPTIVSLDATPRNYDAVGEGYGHHRQAALLELVKTAINRLSYDAAGALVTWSRWAKQSLVDDYGIPAEKVHVIRPGVNLARFHPREDRSEGLPRILFVGGDFERKGGADLLAAMERLGDRAELDVVTARPIVVPAGRIRMHYGVKPHSDTLVDLFRRADIFAFPSRSETFGLAAAEALACGLPVVGTPVGALPEMVKDGITGYVIPPSSPDDLADALGALIDNPTLRATMGEAGLALAREEHDADKNNRHIFSLMRGLAEQAGELRS